MGDRPRASIRHLKLNLILVMDARLLILSRTRARTFYVRVTSRVEILVYNGANSRRICDAGNAARVVAEATQSGG